MATDGRYGNGLLNSKSKSKENPARSVYIVDARIPMVALNGHQTSQIIVFSQTLFCDIITNKNLKFIR